MRFTYPEARVDTHTLPSDFLIDGLGILGLGFAHLVRERESLTEQVRGRLGLQRCPARPAPCIFAQEAMPTYWDGVHALYTPMGQQWQICTSVPQCSVADVMFIVRPAVWLPHAAL